MDNVVLSIVISIAITIAVCKLKFFNYQLLNRRKSKSKYLVICGVWFYTLLQFATEIAVGMCESAGLSSYEIDDAVWICTSVINDFTPIAFILIALGIFAAIESSYDGFLFKDFNGDEKNFVVYGSYEHTQTKKKLNIAAVIITVVVAIFKTCSAVNYVNYKLQHISYFDEYDIYYMIEQIPNCINSVLFTLLHVKIISSCLGLFKKNAIAITDKRLLGIADGCKKVDVMLSAITSVKRYGGGIILKCGYKSYNFKNIDNAVWIVEELSKNISVDVDDNYNSTNNTPTIEIDGIQLF